MATTGSDTNSGSQASPVKTLNKAITLVSSSGGTIVIRGGTYRDWYHNSGNTGFSILTKSITFQAYPHEQVWFDGSDPFPASDWAVDGTGHYAKTWSTPGFCSGKYYQYRFDAQPALSAPCANADRYGSTVANYPAAGDPQTVFEDGVQVPEVTCHAVGSTTQDFSRLTGTSFCYEEDTANSTGKLYLSFNPAGHTMELGVLPTFLVTGSPDMRFLGLGFKHFATDSGDSSNTNSVLYIKGNRSIVENSVFFENASQAVGMGSSTTTGLPAGGSVINHSIFAFNGGNGTGYNGQGGSSSSGLDHFIIKNSVYNNNNAEKFDMNCSASCAGAAIKLAHMDGYTITNNIIENTQGPSSKTSAAWCDTGCHSGVFVGNLVKNNAAVGYHYEQDDTGIIAGNLLVDNGQTGIDFGGQSTKIWNNTIVNSGARDPGNAIELRIYDDSRSLLTSSVSVGNNVIYHPLASGNVTYFGGGNTSTESDANTWFTYLDANSYWRASSMVLYRMIGATDTSYKSSSAYHAAFPAWAANDTDYVGTTDPFFTNAANDDYTIRATSVAYHSGAALPSDVAAALGVTTAAGQTRGAFNWPGK